MASFGEFLFGSPDKLNKIATGTRQQEGLHNNILSQAMGLSGNGGGYDLAQQHFNNLLGSNQQDAFNQFSSPYLQQFQEQLLPQIAERFAGQGALSSSGFGQALGGAASGLQSQLAQLFSSLQQQAAGQQYNQFNQLSNTGLNYQPFAYQQQQGSGGFLAPLLSGIGGAAGGPIGAALGQGIGGGISSLFKGQSGGGGGAMGGGGGGMGGFQMSPGKNTGNFGLPTFLGR
jgi:hypothetical protein